MRKADLLWQRFGKLTVVERIGMNKYRCIEWKCLCDCGKYTKAQTSDLRKGHMISCGCSKFKDRQSRSNNGGPTRIYRIWKNMKKRCLNPNNNDFKYYGARGISVCNEWLEFKPFYEWSMKNGYSETLTIDRINNDGNYEPSNCKWVTRKEQAQHRRPGGTVVKNGIAIA